MHFLQRFWQRRWLRGLVWTAISLVTLGALLLAWSNWKGAREWHAAQAMLQAEGETLDFRATMRDPIPEAENYCAIPLLQDLALVVDDDPAKGAPGERRQRLAGLKMSPPGKGLSRPKLAEALLGRPTDLLAWADWLRPATAVPGPAETRDPAHEILAAFSPHDAIFAELTAGLNRQKAQWTPEWKTRELSSLPASIALPHDANLPAVMQTLSLRAIACARVGDVAQAHETAQVLARLSEASVHDPFLIGLLVGASGSNVLVNLTWELCAAHAGTVEDFARLESALTRLDLSEASLHAWRSELAAMVGNIQYLKANRGAGGLLLSASPVTKSNLSNFVLHAVTAGFFDANSAVFAEKEFHYVIQPLRDHGLLAAQASALVWDQELDEMNQHRWAHPFSLLTAIAAPSTMRIHTRILYTQTLLNQAIIGCALERYRLAHGSYPTTLDPVTLADGRALPLDILSGQPMHYRPTPDGRYALWSVGFDGKDDDGHRTLDSQHPEKTQFSNLKYVGDWVWDFPAN